MRVSTGVDLPWWPAKHGAWRSATAAKEIKMLIDSSIEKDRTGTMLTTSAGLAMGAMIESASRVSAVMSEISDSIQEQSNGIGQVNRR